MSSRQPCAECGHRENEHRDGGCVAIDKTNPAEWRLCPCLDYVPAGGAPRSTLRTTTERSRAHERRMRKLRPATLERDRYRCRCGMAAECNGHAWIVHHLWPTEKGGPDALDNLLSVCETCHRWIHDGSPEQARALGFLRDRL